MAGIPKEHEGLYFDALVRTQKKLSVLSLIHATYHAKKMGLLGDSMKIEIAQRLENAYNLFRKYPKGADSGSGSYTSELAQFESQYTIGHEMCIWKDNSLDLNDEAIEVAENRITITDYFDKIFLNYFQPINGEAIHPVYQITSFMIQNNVDYIEKKNIANALTVECGNEMLNALCNYLKDTSYFDYSNGVLSITSDRTPDEINSLCNTTYIGEVGLRQARIDLVENDSYAEYIFSGSMLEKSTSNVIELERYTLDELTKILQEACDLSEEKVVAIHMFGIRYGELIVQESYSRKEIINKSGLKSSYLTELNKGISLSKYVKEKNKEDITKIIDLETGASIIQVRKPRVGKVNPLNTILYGPPGTGKTYSTVGYALAIIDNELPQFTKDSYDNRKNKVSRFDELVESGRIAFTTFHQSYGYEDFVQGLRPKQDVTLSFDYEDGVFKRISERAMKDSKRDYVLIIDEINRGNISKIFGELITLLEEDKRCGEINQLSINLASGYKFSVPNNLYILGTMNSADKSISLIDSALRRRFDFIERSPEIDMVENEIMRSCLENINLYLRKELRSTDMLIGHSYFMGRDVTHLDNIMNKNIIPLLYEYFYDDENKVKKALSVLDGTGFKVVTSMNARIKVEPNSEQ